MGDIKNSRKRKSKKVFRGNQHTIIKKSRANDDGNYFSNNENPESTTSSARPTDICIEAEKVRQSDEEDCNIFISSLILKEMLESASNVTLLLPFPLIWKRNKGLLYLCYFLAQNVI